MKLFKVLGLFYFFSIMVLGSILFGEQNCISSKLVQSINIHHGEEFVSFQACWSSNVTKKAPQLGDLKTLKLINSSAHEFESYLSRNHWFVGSGQKWVITDTASTEKDKLSVQINPNDSRDINLIRRKVVLSWVNEFRRKYQKSEGMANVILSDIVAFVVWDIGLKNLEQQNSSSLVYSKHSICKSDWAPMDPSVCPARDETSSRLSEWSLRPLFLKAFKKKYTAMSLKQKILFQRDLYSKIISFEVPKNLKFKLGTMEQVLARTDQLFWGGKRSEFNPIFEDLWLYADKEIQSQSLIFNGQHFVNLETQSQFEFENFFIKRIHINGELNLSDIRNFNADYVFVGKSSKVHVPSLRLAYSFEPQVFQMPNPILAIQKVIGWNPVLSTDVDPGI